VVHEHEKPKSLHEKEKKETLKCMLYERKRRGEKIEKTNRNTGDCGSHVRISKSDSFF
jgi:hypothetical protein